MQQSFYAFAYSLLHPWNTDRHYIKFRARHGLLAASDADRRHQVAGPNPDSINHFFSHKANDHKLGLMHPAWHDSLSCVTLERKVVAG